MNKHIIYIILVAAVALYVGYQWGGNSYSVSTHMMSDTMVSMNTHLSDKTGDDFDKAFIDDMITHHQGAVDMATQALVRAKHQEIKDLANAIIAAQNKEIADMKAWKKAWYNQ